MSVGATTCRPVPSMRALLEELAPIIGEAADWFVADAPDPGDGRETLPGMALIDPAEITRLLDRLQAARGWGDRRAAASWWFVVYCEVVLLGTLPALTLAGIALDAGLDNVSLVVDDGAPEALLLHDLGDARRLAGPTGVLGVPSVGDANELRTALVERAYRRNLAPVQEMVHELTRLSRQILWGTVGTITAFSLDELEQAGAPAEVVVAERAALLEDPTLPLLPDGNPLAGTVRRAALGQPDLPAVVSVRRTCCLNYRLGHTCVICPLRSTAEIIDRMREVAAMEE